MKETGNNLWSFDTMRPVSYIFCRQSTSFKYSKKGKTKYLAMIIQDISLAFTIPASLTKSNISLSK